MFKAPERAGAAKAGLHLIAHQQSFVAACPLAQSAHVGDRGEGRAAALVGLQDDARDVLRLDAVFAQAALEQIEGSVERAKAVGKGRLDETAIEIDDPLLQRGNAAGLLRAERA